MNDTTPVSSIGLPNGVVEQNFAMTFVRYRIAYCAKCMGASSDWCNV